jgi:hypothetical protein
MWVDPASGEDTSGEAAPNCEHMGDIARAAKRKRKGQTVSFIEGIDLPMEAKDVDDIEGEIMTVMTPSRRLVVVWVEFI